MDFASLTLTCTMLYGVLFLFLAMANPSTQGLALFPACFDEAEFFNALCPNGSTMYQADTSFFESTGFHTEEEAYAWLIASAYIEPPRASHIDPNSEKKDRRQALRFQPNKAIDIIDLTQD